MKKLSEITESVWADIHRRSNGEQKRQEDGRKVTTRLGVDIFLHNPNSNYNYLIDSLLNKNTDYRVCIIRSKDSTLTPDEMVNVRKWEAPYDYLIYDGLYGTDLVADFWTYDDMKDFDIADVFYDNFSEEDYISICKGISTKLKEVGDCLKYVPHHKSFVHSKQNRKIEIEAATDYEGDYALELINENDIADWGTRHPDDEYWLEDFIYYITDNFKELEETDFITWSYNDYGESIVIPYYSISNLVNFKKYKEFTQNCFKNYEETE